MNFKEFQNNAQRTCVVLANTLMDNLHMTSGMITELREMLKHEDSVNLFEEMGDFDWFFANYCRINNINVDLEKIEVSEEPNKEVFLDLFCAVADLLDIHKNELAYERKVDEEKRTALVFKIATLFVKLCKAYNADLHKIQETLIEKLKKRYKDKFTKEEANNRNLEEERKTLEEGLK